VETMPMRGSADSGITTDIDCMGFAPAGCESQARAGER
jgi:hypothetical protein